GQAWLPIGSPSGLARSLTTPAASNTVSSSRLEHSDTSASSSRQREGVQRIARADHDELPSVEHERNRGVRGRRVKARMPERIAGRRIISDEVTRAIAAEQQIAGRRQKAERSALGERMPPPHLARPVIERLDVAFAAARGGAWDRAAAVA